MKIGVFATNFKLSVEESLAKAQRIGVEGVQLWNVGGALDPDSLSADGRRWFKALVAARGLEISALCGHMNFVHPEGVEERIEKFKRILDLGIELEAPIITTEAGHRTGDEERDWTTLVNAFREICAHAEEVGSYLAIEPGGRGNVIDGTESIKKLVADVDSANLKVNLDPANLMNGGYDPVQAVYELQTRIVHTHAKDCIPEPWKELPLGQGKVPWEPYIAALRDIGYDGFLTIERETGADPVGDITEAKEFLVDLLTGTRV